MDSENKKEISKLIDFHAQKVFNFAIENGQKTIDMTLITYLDSYVSTLPIEICLNPIRTSILALSFSLFQSYLKNCENIKTQDSN